MVYLMSLFTAPSASTVITGVSDYSGTFFTELLPLVYIGCGLLIGAMIALFVMRKVSGAVGKMTGGGKRRGRRR